MTHKLRTKMVLGSIALIGMICATQCAPAATPESGYAPPGMPLEHEAEGPVQEEAQAPPQVQAEPAPSADSPARASGRIGMPEPQVQAGQGLPTTALKEAPPAPAAGQECCPPTVEPYPTLAPLATPWPDDVYAEYQAAPFIDTRYDHLSTFAMDVDTGSYTKMREYVNSNRLPPVDLVRVEEFVNYFNMEYPDPESGAFSINLEGGPSPFGEEGAYLLRVGIQGRHIPEWERKDANLTFVIDASGSMRKGNKMDMVKYGLRQLVNRLSPNDQIGIVAFSDQAWVVLEPTSVRHRKHILRAIEGLRPMASTNTEAGLRLGYSLALRAYRDDATNRVILASDGMANVGITDPNVLVGYARDHRGRDVYLSTVGVGRGGYDDRFMEQLADHGNGNYSYLDSREAAERIFSQDLSGTLQVIAKDAKIQVDFNPYVVYSYRLLGYENRAVADRDFRNDAVDAGEVGAGHSVTALYELYLNPEGGQEVVTVRVRYEDPDTQAVAEISQRFKRSEFQTDFDRTSPRFQLAAAAAQYAEALRYSPWTQDDSLEDVLWLASSVQTQLPFDADVNEFVSLVERASGLAE